VAVPAESGITIDNVQQLIQNMLVDAGVVGIDESIEQPMLNRAFTQLNWLLAQWARKRWLVYRIQDYSFISNGSQDPYPVGAIGTSTVGININPRPDRLEYAFVRFLQNTGNTSGTTPVDVDLDIVKSHEDYARIAVKKVGTLPWRIFYDPEWPLGKLFPWPIPQASLYEIHCGFKVVIPRFSSLQQQINFPPEYEAALNWCGAEVVRESYQMPPSPKLTTIARNALNTMRLANQQVGTLVMPRVLRRGRAYDYRSDSANSY
jgi:hypothetical protein